MSTANVVTPVQGRAVVDVDVDADGAFVPLLATKSVAFDSAEMLDSLNSWNTWDLKLKATTRAVYEQKIVPVLLSKKRKCRIRWGVDTGSKTIWLPYTVGRVFSATPELSTTTASAAGMPFSLRIVDALYDLTLEERVKARRGTPAEIAEDIAAAYGFETVIEPTPGRPLVLVQSYETDFEFLRRLAMLAVNGSGESSFNFYLRGNTFHFQTKSYKQTPYTLVYNADAISGAASLIASDDAQSMAADGGGAAQTVVYDPLAGEVKIVDSNPERYTRFGKRLSQAEGLSLFASHAGPNQVALEENRTQSRYAVARDRYERISVTLANVMTLEAGVVVTLQPANAGDSSAGFYHVEIMHMTVEGGVAKIGVTAARGEFAGTRPDAKQVSAGNNPQVGAPAEAPGKDPAFETTLAAPINKAVKPAGG